jgi:hypothetical protein
MRTTHFWKSSAGASRRSSAARDDVVAIRRVLWARGLRAFADGYVSLLLPVYLIALGFGAFHVGVIATATLLGSGVLTLLMVFRRIDFHTAHGS